MITDNAISVSVSEAALIKRLDRRLSRDDLGIRRCREDSRAYHDLGRYYVKNVIRNFIVWKDIDLEDLGREFDVLQPCERLQSADTV
ncbi:MAG TPA: hypothetical protein VME42_11455 [Steroidobacteraceae bacterium]|nr:hypothetical protein [Steroidobacteraceae bacterium]